MIATVKTALLITRIVFSFTVSINAGGFMFWFQELARKYTDKPVLMSSLVALPSITTAFAHHEQVRYRHVTVE